MNDQYPNEPTFRQFPIRLEPHLAAALDRYAQSTKISKTEIARSAIRRILIDFERTGTRAALEKIHGA